jgi:hypothetical protein
MALEVEATESPIVTEDRESYSLLTVNVPVVFQ